MAYVSVILRSIVVVMGKVRLEGSKHLGIACIMKYSLTHNSSSNYSMVQLPQSVQLASLHNNVLSLLYFLYVK